MDIFAALSNIDEDIILETYPSMPHAYAAVHPREESRLGRFLSSGLVAAVLSVIASVSLIAAIVLAGRLGENPVPRPPIGLESTESGGETTPESRPENPPETRPETSSPVTDTATETDAPTTPETLPETTPPPSEGLAFTSNGDGTCALTGLGTCADTVLVIPALSPDGDRVTLIRASTFRENRNLESVIIPDSVERIGAYAFAQCESLRTIDLGDGVRDIDACAFQECTNLRSVTWSAALQTILGNAFDGCTSLDNITLPDKLNYIDTRAFFGCTSLSDITIPAAARVVSTEAFRGCTALQSITISPGCEALIQPYVFADCPAVQSITLPGSLSRIQNNAFPEHMFERLYITDLAGWCNTTLDYACSNPMPYAREIYFDGKPARDLVIPDGVRKIGKYAFFGCPTILSVIFSDSVRMIDNYAFESCPNLTEVTFGTSLSTIGMSAFDFCESLVRIHIRDMAAYASVDFNQPAGNPFFNGATLYQNVVPVRDLVIPDGVRAIGEGTFAGYTGLVSVSLPAGIERIGESAFEDCTSLADLHFAGTVAEWEAIEKENRWNHQVAATTVKCRDGEVLLGSGG